MSWSHGAWMPTNGFVAPIPAHDHLWSAVLICGVILLRCGVLIQSIDLVSVEHNQSWSFLFVLLNVGGRTWERCCGVRKENKILVAKLM